MNTQIPVVLCIRLVIFRIKVTDIGNLDTEGYHNAIFLSLPKASRPLVESQSAAAG